MSFRWQPDLYTLGIGFADMKRSTGLLEQKGVHHEGGPDKVSHKDPHKDSHKDTHKDNSSSHSGSKDKPSLGERIKNKLHRH